MSVVTVTFMHDEILATGLLRNALDFPEVYEVFYEGMIYLALSGVVEPGVAHAAEYLKIKICRGELSSVQQCWYCSAIDRIMLGV